MNIQTIEFSKLEKDISTQGQSHLDYLAPDIGKVYVIAISRDGCPACEKQKPQLDKLSEKVGDKHGGKVVFTKIHVRQVAGSTKESLRSKDILHHYFYPTNLILLKTADRGAIELYRNASPPMEELERSIEVAAEIAAMFEKEKA